MSVLVPSRTQLSRFPPYCPFLFASESLTTLVLNLHNQNNIPYWAASPNDDAVTQRETWIIPTNLLEKNESGFVGDTPLLTLVEESHR